MDVTSPTLSPSLGSNTAPGFNVGVNPQQEAGPSTRSRVTKKPQKSRLSSSSASPGQDRKSKNLASRKPSAKAAPKKAATKSPLKKRKSTAPVRGNPPPSPGTIQKQRKKQELIKQFNEACRLSELLPGYHTVKIPTLRFPSSPERAVFIFKTLKDRFAEHSFINSLSSGKKLLYLATLMATSKDNNPGPLDGLSHLNQAAANISNPAHRFHLNEKEWRQIEKIYPEVIKLCEKYCEDYSLDDYNKQLQQEVDRLKDYATPYAEAMDMDVEQYLKCLEPQKLDKSRQQTPKAWVVLEQEQPATETVEVLPPSPEQTHRAALACLEKDETELYGHISKSLDCCETDRGLPAPVYSVNPELRKLLVPEDFRKTLEVRQSNCIWHFQLASESASTEGLATIMQKARNATPFSVKSGPVAGVYTDDETQEAEPFILEDQFKGGKKVGSQLTVNPDFQVEEGSRVAIFNYKKKPLTISTGPDASFSTGYENGIILKACQNSEGAIEWVKEADYLWQEIDIDSNPLQRDSGPKILASDGQSELQLLSDEGEYFIPPEQLQTLAQQQSKGINVPIVCRSQQEIQSALEPLFARTRGGRQEESPPISFLAYNPSNNHVVMVRALKKQGKVLIYIHETLGIEDSDRSSISQVTEAIKPWLPKHNIHVMQPNFVIQKDYASCGVFALKAARAFGKPALALDEKLWSLCAQNKVPRQKGLKVDEQSYLSIEQIPAVLLKGYQGPVSQLSEEQMNTIVSQKKNLTLAEYRHKHRTSGSSNGNGANLSTTGKRYKYFGRLQTNGNEEEPTHQTTLAELLNPSQPMKKEDSSEPQPMETTPTTEVVTLQGANFSELLRAVLLLKDRDEINHYLIQHFPQIAPVSKLDWGVTKLYEKIMETGYTLSGHEKEIMDHWFYRQAQSLQDLGSIQSQLPLIMCHVSQLQAEEKCSREQAIDKVVNKLREGIVSELSQPCSGTSTRKRPSVQTFSSPPKLNSLSLNPLLQLRCDEFIPTTIIS